MLEKLPIQDFCEERSLAIVSSLVSLFKKRRSTRHFRPITFDLEIIKQAIAIAGTAPSGANKQPWSFAIISNPNIKATIRHWAELEEEDFYSKKSSQKWLDDLKPLHTDTKKEFLTEASYLIGIFFSNYGLDQTGAKFSHYYVRESVGIATGFLLSTLHMAGLSTLTYTPSNRRNLTRLLRRPDNENTYMVIAVGLPKDSAKVPTISKKTINEILTIYRNVDERNQQKPTT